MEPCSTYKPWHDKQSGKTFLKPDQGKCLHYYFYLMDEELGLCYVRVPTLAALPVAGLLQRPQLAGPAIETQRNRHKLVDNAFTEVGDWERAQKISDSWQARRLHWKLDEFARRFCPIHKHFGLAYHGASIRLSTLPT